MRDSIPYRALWIGQIVSLLGTQMRIVAVSFQIFELTGSTAAVGLLGLAEVIPSIAFSMLGGAIADRYDRRAVIKRSQIGLLLSSALLAAVSFGEDPSLVAIYALSAIAAAFQSIDRPARSAIVPSLVSEAKLPAALALRQVVFQTTQVAGPLAGGILLAALSGDVAWIYVIDAASFSAALASLRWVPSTEATPAAEAEPALAAIREGVRFAVRSPVILSILVIDLIAMVFGMPRAAFPELARDAFDGGGRVLGILYAAPAVGALVAAVTTGWVGRIHRQGLAVIAAVLVWGIAVAAAGLVIPSLAWTVALLAIAGGADVISAIFRGTILNLETPDQLRGRVNSVNLMIVTGGPRLGDAEAGLAAALVGARESVILGGFACVAGTAALAASSPVLRKYQATKRVLS